MKNVLIFFALLITLNAAAQDASTVRLDKMKPVHFITGNWKGDGWMIMEDGQKHSFNQTENVTSQLDGGVLLIVGKGKDPKTGKLIHDAFAMLTYDVRKQQYRWTAMTSAGYTTDVVPEVKGDTFVWTLNTSKTGKIRYSIKLDKGDWFEIGEISTDEGQTWKQNFEMRLKKV